MAGTAFAAPNLLSSACTMVSEMKRSWPNDGICEKSVCCAKMSFAYVRTRCSSSALLFRAPAKLRMRDTIWKLGEARLRAI